ncbi:type IV pilus biogenesis protein PilM [Pseudomonas sp. NPDC089401]|uniref:type IV pilus biogenesis protein PilM n=1 Tax=Pseudomonas sp. NPDC089401 TaxID=3364462 RepID=UPI0037F9F05E
MLGRLGKDAGSLLGVEIAPDSIRMAQLRRRGGCCERIAWAYQAFDPGTAANGWQDLDRVASALRSAHRQCGSRQRRAAVALPASQVICKVIELPAGLPDSERETRLLADAEQLFPFPLEELVLDFQVLGTSAARPGHRDILVAACRQSALRPYETVFDEAGLQLDAVEVDSIALRRMIPLQASGDAALLRIEAGSLTLHGWRQEALPLRREWPAGAVLERSAGVFGDGLAPDELFVTAVEGVERDAPARLSEALGVPCRPLPPVAGLDCSDSAMTLACALALGGMR